MTRSLTLSVLALVASAAAHQTLWDEGMFCLGGPSGTDQNSNSMVSPLYQMSKADWWMHGVNGCNNHPPAAGKYMKLPAGGTYHGEIANNQAFTSLGFGGKYAGDWPAGTTAPVIPGGNNCVSSPLLHTPNEAGAAGTALAIADVTDINDVTPENLVVFSVAYNTPWRRQIAYDVPADMPACSGEWCICVWGWVPNHCGQPNMYMSPFRCQVTGATSTKKLGVAKPPTWCEGNESSCTTGPKQMIYYNQNEGNNVAFAANVFQADGQTRSPNYNMKMGFKDGAQNDIFVGGGSSPAVAAKPSSTSTKPVATSTSEKPASTSAHSSVQAQVKVAPSSSAAPTTSSKVPSKPSTSSHPSSSSSAHESSSHSHSSSHVASSSSSSHVPTTTSTPAPSSTLPTSSHQPTSTSSAKAKICSAKKRRRQLDAAKRHHHDSALARRTYESHLHNKQHL